MVEDRSGHSRTIFRTVGNNSSFGGKSLVETIGLLDDASVSELSMTWPRSRTTQTFRDLVADRALIIIEGVDVIQPSARACVTGTSIAAFPL